MQAGVTAKPEVGAAAFFSYMDPETKIKDTGFTTHSGCPVIEGTKRIAVHWMRIGVDAENPWDSFNTRKLSIQCHVVYACWNAFVSCICVMYSTTIVQSRSRKAMLKIAENF
jgi:hypothetical protein